MRISRKLAAGAHNRYYAKLIDNRGKDRVRQGFGAKGLFGSFGDGRAAALVERASTYRPPQPPPDKLGCPARVPPDAPRSSRAVLRIAAPARKPVSASQQSLRDHIPLDGGAFARRPPLVRFRRTR